MLIFMYIFLAMKLSNNPPDYDGYACPRGQVEAGPNRKHGLQLRNGRLYRHDNQVVAPGQFHLSEQDLIEEFGNWISRRYDTGLVTNNAFLSALFLGRENFANFIVQDRTKFPLVPLNDCLVLVRHSC